VCGRPEIHHSQTASNLLSLLLAPINSYQSALTLLALPRYTPLLQAQPFQTRKTIAHAVVTSIIKNDTSLETPEDVSGIFDLAHVLVKDERAPAQHPDTPNPGGRHSGYPSLDTEDVADEQGWVARVVHLFRADTLDLQFEVFQAEG
jgi:vacuolar protein sorting-associated protein 35